MIRLMSDLKNIYMNFDIHGKDFDKTSGFEEFKYTVCHTMGENERGARGAWQ